MGVVWTGLVWDILFFYFNSQVHLQSVQEHSAKGVRRRACRGAPSSDPSQILGVKPCVFDGKETYELNLELRYN
jgi:hypothetical protein